VSRAGTKNNKTDSGQNLVTILFVVGLIGWGFFAIDRLTESKEAVRPQRIQGRALGHEAGWKKSARDWLNKKLAIVSEPAQSANNRISRNVPQEDIPLRPDPKGFRPEEELQVDQSLPTSLTADADDEIAASGEAKESAFLLYKLNKRGLPVLTRVRRQGIPAHDLKALTRQLIKGPSIGEQERDFIDSFIRKPRVLGAGKSGECTFVNFDRNFGAGVSYQTLRYQIQQLFRNVELWSGASCLELRIDGKYNAHLGSDGLHLPRKIDAAWLKENL